MRRFMIVMKDVTTHEMTVEAEDIDTAIEEANKEMYITGAGNGIVSRYSAMEPAYCDDAWEVDDRGSFVSVNG